MASGLSAVDEGVSGVSLGASADGGVASGFADGVGAALSGARVDARVVDAGAGVAALAVALAFAASAVSERIAGVSGQASAHWTLLAGVVVAWDALGVGSARVRAAQVL